MADFQATYAILRRRVHTVLNSDQEFPELIDPQVFTSRPTCMAGRFATASSLVQFDVQGNEASHPSPVSIALAVVNGKVGGHSSTQHNILRLNRVDSSKTPAGLHLVSTPREARSSHKAGMIVARQRGVFQSTGGSTTNYDAQDAARPGSWGRRPAPASRRRGAGCQLVMQHANPEHPPRIS
jgi:hypothetical protein